MKKAHISFRRFVGVQIGLFLVLGWAGILRGAAADQVFYAKASGQSGAQRFYETYSLSDGTFVVAGASDDLTWVPSGVTTTELTNTASISSHSSGKVGFLAHFSSDLTTVLRVVHFPAGKVPEVRRIRGTEVPGSTTGDLFISGMRSNGSPDGYFIAKLNDNFVSGAPAALAWSYDVEAEPREAGGGGGTSTYKEMQPWDVTSDGRVFHGRGAENDWSWAAVEIIKADGSGSDKLVGFPSHRGSVSGAGEWYGDGNDYPGGFGGIDKSSIVLRANRDGGLHSVSYSDHHRILPDGHGGFKKGTRPEDIYYKRPGVGGRGYNGYAMTTKPSWRPAMLSIDRRNNHLYIGGNVQTTHSDGIADFEAQVVAFDGDGYMKWWSRLYTELNGNEGLYQSADSGANWSGATGLSDPHVRAIAYAPSQTSTVYAGTIHGVGKSTDGGATWIMVNSGMTDKQVVGLAVHPTNANIVYAACLSGVWKTTNGGTSWADVTGAIAFSPRLTGVTEKSVTSIAIHPTSTDTVIVGTGGGGAYRSTNGGSSWTVVSGFETVAVKNTKNAFVYDVDFKPGDPSTVYFSTFGDGVYQSTDGGLSASKMSAQPDDKVYALVISSSNPSLMYAATEVQVKKSTDGGASWSGTTDMGNTGGNIKALALSPSDNNTLLAGDLYSGLFYTTDGGSSWSRREGSSPNKLPTASNTSSKVGRSTIYAVAFHPSDASKVLVGSIGIANNSIPDQYVDALVVDYSKPEASGDVIAIAREHGGDHTLFWKGNTIPASINPSNPGYSFNHLLGDSGNVHISWIGRFRASNGDILNSTWLAEYGNSGDYGNSPHNNPLLDKWPNQNSGWPDSNTTRTDNRMPIVDSQGRLYVVATGRRTITTTNAFQKMAHPRYPGTVNSGSSSTSFQSDDLIGRGDSIIPGVSTITFQSGTQDNKSGTIATFNSLTGDVTLSGSNLTGAPANGDTFHLWEGESSWNDFVRVYAADFTTVIYSSILTGDWDRSTQQGGDNVTLHGIVPVQDGVLVSGFHTGTAGVADGNTMPTRNVPAWGSSTPNGETAVLGRMYFYEVDNPGSLSFLTSTTPVDESAGTVTVSVVRNNGSSGEVSVTVQSANGTATAGEDYTSVNTVLTWADGTSDVKTVTVPITNDSILNEGTQTFSLSLSSPSGSATLGTYDAHTVSILEDDLTGSLQFTSSAYLVGEGDGTVTLTVERSNGSLGSASVQWATADDSALAGTDYVSGSGTLNWSSGDSSPKNIVLTVSDNALTDGPKVFTVDLSSLTGGTAGEPTQAVVTIQDDEWGPASIGTLAIWLKDADTDFNGTQWTDSSGNGNHMTPLGSVGNVTFGSPTTVTETPSTGAWSGQTVPAVKFASAVDDMLATSNVNGNVGLTDLTILAVVRTAGTDQASAEFRQAGFGSRAAENTSSSSGNFQISSDGSLRYDDGNNEGTAIPTDLHLRVARLDSGKVKNWIHNGSLTVTIAETSSSTSGTIPNPTRVDEFYLGDISGGATANTGYTATTDADLVVASLMVYTTALSDSDIAQLSTYLLESVGQVPPGFTVSESSLTVNENAGSGTVTVVLDREPVGDVVVSVQSSDSNELTVSPSLMTFTTGNWDSPQVVTVTGVDDAVSGSHTANVILSVVDASSSNEYDSVADQIVPVSLTDDELPPPPTNGLVLFYPFEEGSGTTTSDEAGSNNGTLNNSVQWTSGQIGNALDFDLSGGSGIYEDVTSGASVNVAANSSWTATAWVNLDTIPTNNVLILQQGGDGRSWLAVTPERKLFSFVGGEATESTSVLTIGQWHHVAISAGNGSIKLYLDGTNVATRLDDMEVAEGIFHIGNHKSPADDKQWDGTIDEVRLYNRVLSPQEVADIAAYAMTAQQQYFVASGLTYDVDPTVDSDSDGMSNEDEFTAGTNPNSPSSVFKLTPSSAAGGMNVQTPTVSGKYYRVSWRDFLTSGGWTAVAGYEGTAVSTGLAIDFDVTLEGFYRVEVSATAFPTP